MCSKSNIKLLFIFATIFIINALIVNGIGVNYGILGNDLPSPVNTIALLKSKGITKIRIFTPNHDILEALRGSGINVLVGTLNQDLPNLAQDPTFATKWVQENILPYANNVIISGVSAGNELENDPLGKYALGAIQNLDNALQAANIKVPVTTTVSYGVMGSSYPPSSGSFNPNVLAFITPVVKFLNSKGYPLATNIYPYFAYVSNPKDISIDYALLKGNTIPNIDNDLKYTDLFSAMVDALYAALEKVGAGNVNVIVTETGWPSAQGASATIEFAKEYNNNLIRLVDSGKGTPRKPGKKLDVYIFAMFNENQKPAGIEQNWGLFYPSLKEVYPVNFGQQSYVVTVNEGFAERVNFDPKQSESDLENDFPRNANFDLQTNDQNVEEKFPNNVNFDLQTSESDVDEIFPENVNFGLHTNAPNVEESLTENEYE